MANVCWRFPMTRSASFLILAVLFTQAQFAFSATKSNSTPEQSRATGTQELGIMDQVLMVAPLFVEDQDFDSTLVIVNAARSAEYADVSIRGLNGGVISSRRVGIAPHDQTRLEIADLLKSSGSLVTAGSVVVMAAPGSGSAVAAALSITHRTRPELNYIDEELLMVNMNGSEVLQGVADSGSGSPLIALTSVIETVQHVRVDCLDKNGRDVSKTVDLAPAETIVTDACSARTDRGVDFEAVLNKRNDRPSGPFGIALKSDAMAGSFLAFGLMSHEKGNARFFSTISFADPRALMSSTTVFVGVPVGQSALLSGGNYVPQVSVSNFGGNDVQMRVQYAESSDGNATVRDLVTINVPRMSSKEVSLSILEGGPGLTNSFLVTSNAAPGELVSKLVAKNDEQPREIELLGKDAMDPQNGGNHPWSIENGTQSVILLFNNDQHEQSFSVIIAGDTTIWRKTYKLQPMQTQMINITTLARSQARDDHGVVLPAKLLSGDVYWFTAGGMGRGRVLQANAAKGMARSFSCGMFATPCSPATLDLIPPTIPATGESTADFSYQICGAPDQYSCTGPATSGSNDFPTSWSSENTRVATAGGGGDIGSVVGEGAGTTEIIATATNNYGTCSVAAGADVAVLQPYQVEPVAFSQPGPAVCPKSPAGVQEHGWSQSVTNQVQTSTGTPIPYAGLTMADTLTVVVPNTLGVSGTVQRSTVTDSNGDFPDTYFVCSTACPGNGTASALQSWTYNGVNLQHINSIHYSCTDITIDGH